MDFKIDSSLDKKVALNILYLKDDICDVILDFDINKVTNIS